MRPIYLCAPFRTFFSLNKGRVFLCRDRFHDVLSKVVDELEVYDPAMRYEVFSSGGKASEPLYVTLEDDSSQSSFNPVVSITLDFLEVLGRLPEELADEVSSWLDVSSIDCRIGLYDNTIGILEFFALPCKEWREFDSGDARLLDSFTTRLCGCLVSMFNGVFDRFVDRVLARQGKDGFIYSRSQFVAFSDVLKFRDIRCGRLMWVGRTICLQDQGESCDFYNAWVDGSYSGGLSINSGNNLIGGRFSVDDVSRPMVICQYFNSALTVLNMNLDEVNALEEYFDRNYKKISVMKRQAELFDIEEISVKNGLQGKRRELCGKVFLAWHHDELRGLVRKRLDLIGARLQELHTRKVRRYSSVMEALLAFIGAVTLVDVSLSLYTFTNVEYLQGPPWSVLELMRSIEPDIFVSVLVLISIVFGVFYVRKQKS